LVSGCGKEEYMSIAKAALSAGKRKKKKEERNNQEISLLFPIPCSLT
jgi:hypothetical protein